MKGRTIAIIVVVTLIILVPVIWIGSLVASGRSPFRYQTVNLANKDVTTEDMDYLTARVDFYDHQDVPYYNGEQISYYIAFYKILLTESELESLFNENSLYLSNGSAKVYYLYGERIVTGYDYIVNIDGVWRTPGYPLDDRFELGKMLSTLVTITNS